MTRFLFDTATTINGWIADEENSLAWLFAVEGGESPEEGLFPTTATVMVEGSTTYEWVLAAEDLLARPERWQELHGDRPTFVFTTRDLPVPAGADVRLVGGPVVEALPALREAAGDGDVWVVGGGQLQRAFLDAEALDRLDLFVVPVLLGTGIPLFPSSDHRQSLVLADLTRHGQLAHMVFERPA